MPAAKCEQVVGFKIDDYGDVIDEIECANPASFRVDGALACDECRARIVADESTFVVGPANSADEES